MTCKRCGVEITGHPLKVYCEICKRDVRNEYRRKSKIGAKAVKVRRITLKQKAVEFLGGKCILCGYDKYQGALEFHHRNPDEKDFQISGTIRYGWEKVKEELKKCILVCSNCHKEVHAGLHNEEI